MKERVIIWGHKLHSHTHSYIHNAYYNAFKRLGYETYWFDKNDDVSNFNFENCIFLTEDQAHQNIPLNKSSKYILHHCKLQKYINAGCNYINLCNYVNDCRLGLSFNYNQDGVTGNTVEKITYYSYFDSKNKALYQPWATDLFPEDIPNEPIKFDSNKKDIYYVGSVYYENAALVEAFRKTCSDNGKNFINKTKISDEEAIKLIKGSYIYPDIRDNHHIKVGYVPCRIFKNISYGCIPSTNSQYVRDFFGVNTIPYSDINNLLTTSTNYLSNNDNYENSKFLMNEVKEHHTYITRIKTILSLF